MPTFASTDVADFKRQFRKALHEVIGMKQPGQEFTTDDVWGLLTLQGAENRSPDPATPGTLMRQAAIAGQIANTGRSQISRRGPAAGRRVSVWRVI